MTSKNEIGVTLDELRKTLLNLEPQNDLGGFFVSAARALLEGTGSRACGITRRQRGAARDLAVLVPAEGEPQWKAVPLDEEERYQPLPRAPEGGFSSTFCSKALKLIESERQCNPIRVAVATVAYHGHLVVTAELVDPDPERLGDLAALDALLAEAAPLFKLAVLQERLRRERFEAHLLHRVGQELGRTLDLQELLNTGLDLLRRVVPYDAAAIYLLKRDELDAVHHSMRGYAEYQHDIVNLKLDQGVVGWVAQTGEAAVIPDVTAEQRYLEARPETRSEMVVPLKSGGRVMGVFILENDRRAAYSGHDLELLETFAGQAAAALERARLLEEAQIKRRLENELVIARSIQESFLPKPSETLARRRLVGKSLPSKEVSGDYFDFLEREDGSVAIALADVSGKGIPAALIMASLRAAFRLGAAEGTDAAVLCRELNTFLLGSTQDTEFATGVFGFLDAEQRRFRFCNAGHNAPLVLRKDGSVTWLGSGGMMLGAFPDREYTDDVVDLEPGDLLVMYTDGVTEAYRDDDEFGSERLLATVKDHAHDPPAVVCDAILNAVHSFVDGVLPDDLTLVLVEGGLSR